MAEFRKSYAQVSEDLLAAYYLQRDTDIRYVDVGCLWPIRHSSTYYFYERGGEGVCVDPNPEAPAPFLGVRPRDSFANCGISNEPGEMQYFAFENPVFNTFSETRAAELQRSGRKGRNLVRTFSVPVKSLTQVLVEQKWRDRYGPTADLLSVDVEGHEHQVISSLDFTYVRPRVVIVEMMVKSEPENFPKAREHLLASGYRVCGQTGHDMFFISDS